MTKREGHRRLPRRALPGAVALVVAGAPVVVPAHVAAASEPVREVLVVSPVSGPVTTQSTLLVGGRYRVHVEGTYEVDGTRADAECVRSSVLLWGRGGADHELLIDGRDVDWQPVAAGVTGCDTSGHGYTVEAVVASNALTFSLQLPEGAAGFGELEVVVEGPPGADASASDVPASEPAAPADGGSHEGAPETGDGPGTPPGGDHRSAGDPAGPVAEPTGGGDAAAGRDLPGGAASSADPTGTEVLASDVPSTDGPGTSEGADERSGLRQLTAEELFDVLAPHRGADEGAAGRQPSTIELAARPERMHAEPPAGAVAPIAGGLLLALLLAALTWRGGGRLALHAVAAQLQDCWEIAGGRSRRRAVAHRPTPRP